MLKIDPKNSRLVFTPKSTWKTGFHHHESCFFHIISASDPHQNIKAHQIPHGIMTFQDFILSISLLLAIQNVVKPINFSPANPIPI